MELCGAGRIYMTLAVKREADERATSAKLIGTLSTPWGHPLIKRNSTTTWWGTQLGTRVRPRAVPRLTCCWTAHVAAASPRRFGFSSAALKGWDEQAMNRAGVHESAMIRRRCDSHLHYCRRSTYGRRAASVVLLRNRKTRSDQALIVSDYVSATLQSAQLRDRDDEGDTLSI